MGVAVSAQEASWSSDAVADSARMSISFVICCHNSVGRLPPTLKSLAALDASGDLVWGVLLVDNASADATVATAERCWLEAGAPAPLRVVEEPLAGLAHARRRGVHAARHEIVCFVDDDNSIGSNWGQDLREVFMAHPDVGAVGGLGRPIFEGAEPPWFSSVQWAYAVGPQAPRSGEVPPARGYLYGAGLAIRRAAFLDLERTGFRPLLTGRRGSELSSGEDSELCFALGLAGWRLWYDERLVFEHFMPAARLNTAYAAHLVDRIGFATACLDAYLVAGSVARPLYWRWLNRLFLPRFLIAGAKYVRECLSQQDLTRHFFKGRLTGVVAGRRRYRLLRRAVAEMARRNPATGGNRVVAR
jgi:GT2 family glycosyltransferase